MARDITGNGALWEENPPPTSPLEDVAHPEDLSKRPDYFEWWYFDASMQTGERVVFEFHYSLFFVGPRVPMVVLKIRDSDGQVYSRGHIFRGGWNSEGGVTASTKSVDVKFGNKGFVRGVYPDYHVNMEHENIGADLKFHFLSPAWMAPEHAWFPLAYHEGATGDTFKHLILPSAEVEGTIRIYDRVKEVRGRGYHDHQWGNIAFRDVISHWYWGRAMSQDQLLCFMNSGRAPGGERYPEEVNGLIVVDRGQILLVTNQVGFKASDFVHDDVTKKDIPQRMEFRVQREGYEVNAIVNIKQIMGRADFRPRGHYVTAYARTVGEYKANLDLKGKRSQSSGDVMIGNMFFH